MLAREESDLGLGFWFRWFMACAIAFVVGLPLFPVVINPNRAALGPVLTDALIGAVGGLGFGIAQWFLLRRRVTGAGWWIVASLVGFVAGFALSALLSMEPDSSPSAAAVAGLLVGLIAGLLEWLVLRKKVHGSLLWVLVSALVWTVSVTLGQLVTGQRGSPLMADVIRSLLAAALTGIGMAWVLRQSVSAPARQQMASP